MIVTGFSYEIYFGNVSGIVSGIVPGNVSADMCNIALETFPVNPFPQKKCILSRIHNISDFILCIMNNGKEAGS